VAERVQGVLGSGRAAAFTVSDTGLLAYREGLAAGGYTLTWFDRSGVKAEGIGTPQFAAGDIQFSPDRGLVAMTILEGTNVDVWTYDVSRGIRSRLTFDAANDSGAVWSPDGRSVIFRSNRKGHFDLYRKTVDSLAAEELVYADDLDKVPTSWSADGRFVLYNAPVRDRGQDMWVLPLIPERPGAPLQPFPLLQARFNEQLGQFSPDGRWILYVSDESQRNELYVAPFGELSRGLGGKRQVSGAGGFLVGGTPRWRHDGREIFYVGPDRRLTAAEVAITGNTIDVGVSRTLFQMPSELRQAFDVSRDGRRFLLLAAPEEKSILPITLVQNWASSLTSAN
jgi:Tol biopolymer transport system component